MAKKNSSKSKVVTREQYEADLVKSGDYTPKGAKIAVTRAINAGKLNLSKKGITVPAADAA